MPDHRFFNELLALEQNPLIGNHHMLVVGTFNAADQDGLHNDAEWFYGRYANEFWYLFPQLLGEPSLHRREHPGIPLPELADRWRNFSDVNDITFIDVYKSIDGILPNHGDNAIANPAHFTAFDYHAAFANCTFDLVLFTWKGRTRATVLGRLKEQIHEFVNSENKYHMVSPSYAYPRSKEFKRTQWTTAFG